jgi:NAD(P)-dependent dehydrogenase (short-subunit alcohol dehydrogenase family)
VTASAGERPVVVLTGATSGIGRAAAVALARQGVRLVLVARDAERAANTVAHIAETTGNRDVDVVLGDLAVQRDVRAVAAELRARAPRIDVLLNNAGVVNLRYTTTVDGIETTFAVNHLAYFMLTLLLRESLQAAGEARIVNVASDAHRWGRLDFDDLGNARKYRAMRVYGQSKLCNILFTYELARRLAETSITANCLHPGAVATRLGQNNGRIATALTKMLAPFFRTPEGGADTAVHLATSPDVRGTTGGYFANRRAIRSSRLSYDPDVQRRLWDASEALSGVRW